MEGFTEEFEEGFMELLRRSHPHSRVAAKIVYNDYISDPCAPPSLSHCSFLCFEHSHVPAMIPRTTGTSLTRAHLHPLRPRIALTSPSLLSALPNSGIEGIQH